jgi:DNA-binding NarL/FixJ family response regulator
VAVTSEEALYATLKEREADILLVDAHFVKCASAYVVGLLNQWYGKMRIVVFELKARTAFAASRFILFGAESYLCKRDSSFAYHREIAMILDGETRIPEDVQKEVDAANEKPDNFKFGKTQKRILDLLAEGNNYDEIADHLRRTEKTVRNTVSAMYRKAGVRSSHVELLLFAENRRLIPKGWFRELSADCENGLPLGGADTRPKFPPLLVWAG